MKKEIKDVFLGGSCNPTNWRNEIAIPFLEKQGITYFNPQVENWYEELMEEESYQKNNSKVLLFVINEQTRSISSMIEVVEYIFLKKNVFVVINYIKDNSIIDKELITGNQLKDLNRGRKYLKDILYRNKIHVYDNVKLALYDIENFLNDNKNKKTNENWD